MRTRALLPVLALSAAAVLVTAACSGDDPAAEGTVVSAATMTSPAPSGEAGRAARTAELFAGVGSDDPGCTYAVGRDGRVVAAGAVGAARLDPLEPMTPETVVDIGSTSKQFTATAVLLLAQRGQVELDAPLSRYLPGLPDWAGRVSVAQAMHHVSGIPDYIGLLVEGGADIRGRTTDADALAALEGTTLELTPGERFAYSNSNYFLLGQVVLAVTGRDLGAFLADEVFAPLALDAVMDPTASIPGKAASYERDLDGGWASADSRWEQLGDGGVQTTPSELVRWAAEYWDPVVGGDALLAARLAGAVPDGAGLYGAGIEERQEPGLGRVLSHTGAWGGFVTTFEVMPEERLAVAATCAAAELPPVREGIGTDMLRIWAG